MDKRQWYNIIVVTSERETDVIASTLHMTGSDLA